MNEKLQEINEENFIVFIYFILLSIYLYANTIEVKYLKYGDIEARDQYRMLLYVVFGISFLITLYYLIESINDLKQLADVDIQKLKELSTFANILILLATGIYLYIIYKDKEINLEVSP